MIFKKPFYSQCLDIVHETLDICRDEVELTVSRGKFVFQSVANGYCVTVIPDATCELENETGLHHFIDDSFSEYELSDLLDRACKSGYDQIFLHREVA